MKSILLISAMIISYNVNSYAKEVKKTVDVDKSVVSWTGKKKILSDKHNGNIKIKEGVVVFNDKGVPLNAELKIDMKTITNEDIKDKKYKEKIVKHLSSDDFFAVKTYPLSILKIESFAKDNINKKDDVKNATIYKAMGELKIKDKTEKISFPIQITSAKEGVHRGTGKFKIDRTRWGVKYGSDSFFKGLGDKVISDEVEFDFDVVTK